MSGVEPDGRVVGLQRVVEEPRVDGRVLDDEAAVHDGVGAERDVLRGLRSRETDIRLEPLTPIIDQAHQADRDVEQHGRQPGDPVEALLRLRVEDAERPECLHARCFVEM